MIILNEANNGNSHYEMPLNKTTYPDSSLLSFKDTVIATTSNQYACPVALRCDLPLDAIELELHGYQHGFFEYDNDVRLSTFETLEKLDIDVLAYFCDNNGPNFNVLKLEQYAKRFNIKLCQVVLPFCPSGMAMWDDSQWRIFDARLIEAIGRVASGCSQSLKLQGGQHHATFH